MEQTIAFRNSFRGFRIQGKWFALLLFLVASLIISGCATAPTDPVARAEYERINDPIEPVNRAVFSFNTVFQSIIIEPLALLFNTLPDGVRMAVGNFLQNLGEPKNIANALLQGKFEEAGHSTGRFLANSTVGLGGLIEVTGPEHHYPNSFGNTLALWPGGQSAYLELPFLGSSSVTDGLGFLVDGLYSIPKIDYNRNQKLFFPVAVGVTTGVKAYADNIDTIDNVRKNVADPYIAFRSAYRQRRTVEIYGKSFGIESLEID